MIPQKYSWRCVPRALAIVLSLGIAMPSFPVTGPSLPHGRAVPSLTEALQLPVVGAHQNISAKPPFGRTLESLEAHKTNLVSEVTDDEIDRMERYKKTMDLYLQIEELRQN